MSLELRQKVLLFQITTVVGVVFGLVGFSYNVWRMEITEANNNIRTACFEILTELAELEQLVYTAHYDGNVTEGSPRKGWVRVGLVADLSALASGAVEREAAGLKAVWSANWEVYATDQTAVDAIVAAIDAVRAEIKRVLRDLE